MSHIIFTDIDNEHHVVPKDMLHLHSRIEPDGEYWARVVAGKDYSSYRLDKIEFDRLSIDLVCAGLV